MIFCQFVKSEIDEILENANLTNDEKEIFVLLSEGFTEIQVADRVNLSTATISRKIKKIKNKIKRK